VEQEVAVSVDVVVVGLGHTGLPVAVAAARSGLNVVGMDASAARIHEVKTGKPGCGLTTVDECELLALLSGPLTVRTGPVPSADVYVLCVPHCELLGAADGVAGSLRNGDLVVVQSTCPIGMTEDILIPRLASRTDAGFHLVYSPVRLDPGRARTAVPRVLAGMTEDSVFMASRFLHEIGEEVVPLGGIRAAELTKVFENTFRLVNISLVNELAELCQKSQVDVHEVLAAAATKPYGFLRHEPGPGAGGDCVPVCGEFFAAAALEYRSKAGIVEAALARNDTMADEIVKRLPAHPGRVLVVGVTYKPDVADVRRSVAVRVIEKLRYSADDVSYHDPYVPTLTLADGTVLRSRWIRPDVADLVLVITRHRGMDLSGLRTPVIDCSAGPYSTVEYHND
jgi:UDP-N-acetyl-D-glucosamine dehydrogenase